jgi:hypothetical protein
MDDNFHTVKQSIRDLIVIIRSNNNATLVGSLEATDALQHIVFNKIPCMKMIDNDINDIMEDTNLRIDLKLNSKYVKYRINYNNK